MRSIVAALARATLVSSFALALGCSASPGSGGFEESNGDANSSGGSPTGGSGSSNDGSGGNGFDPGATSGGQGGNGLDACATSSEEATLVPIDMFITVDRSGSMDDNNKFVNARSAFEQFFQDAGASNLNVALRFWPDAGCDDGSCSTAVCSNPQVAIGPLSDPNHVNQLTAKFDAEFPDGNTPMSAALAGAEQWATTYTQLNESDKVVVVLLTDGEPNGCNEDINYIAGLAEPPNQQYGVLTFAVGLAGSNEAQMDLIAKKGGTQQGFFIGNGNAQQDLLLALQQIQKSTVACEFQMPQGQPGDTIDPTKVNVTYTPGGGGSPQTIGQVPDAGSCAAGGWYYDDPANPTTINLCPTTCQSVQNDPGAKIGIVLGCSTTPA